MNPDPSFNRLARIAKGLEKAKSAKSGEHVDVSWKGSGAEDDYLVCVRCGLVKPDAGWVRPCVGYIPSLSVLSARKVGA